MSDRPSVLQVLQSGREGTAGTYANVTRRFRSMEVTFSPQADVDELKADGHKFVTLTALNREWSEIDATIEPDYNELTYLFADVFALPSGGTPTIAGTTAAGTAYLWTFSPSTTAGDSFATYTLEYGDANHAEACTHVQWTDFSMDISRQDISVSAGAIGQLTRKATLTGGAAFMSEGQKPVLPGQVSFFLDDTAAALGTTELTRGMMATFTISGRVTPVWPVDASNASFATVVEATDIDLGVTLTLGADTVGTALYNTLRRGDTKFLRIMAEGGTTYGGTHLYTMLLDVALQVIDAPDPDSIDDLHVWQWTLRGVHDATWGKAVNATLKNGLSSLS